MWPRGAVNLARMFRLGADEAGDSDEDRNVPRLQTVQWTRRFFGHTATVKQNARHAAYLALRRGCPCQKLKLGRIGGAVRQGLAR